MKDLYELTLEELCEQTTAQVIDAGRLLRAGEITYADFDRIYDNAMRQKNAWYLRHRGISFDDYFAEILSTAMGRKAA